MAHITHNHGHRHEDRPDYVQFHGHWHRHTDKDRENHGHGHSFADLWPHPDSEREDASNSDWLLTREPKRKKRAVKA